MACDSLNQQANLLTVSLGSLPEGFCPSSMQELGDAIAARLVITPSGSSSSFAIGPVAPTSNVGPWLNNCEQWFVWDDNLAMYVKMEVIGAFNNLTVFNASGNFTVPENIFKIRVEGWGGGGGGGNTVAGPVGGCGGAGSGYASKIFDVIPFQVIPVTIGAGGAPGAPGGDGGDTTVLTMTAGGGKGGASASGTTSVGGTHSGDDYGTNGQCGMSGNSFVSGDAGDSGGGGGGGGVQDIVGTCNNGAVPGGGGRGGLTGVSNPGTGGNGRALIWY